MGINIQTLECLQRHNLLQPGTSMLELGGQNLYFGEEFGRVAKQYFENLGIRHTSIDIYECNGSLIQDLRRPFDLGKFDVVTDFGTIEHVDSGVEGTYMAFRNVHDACKVGGHMVHNLPLTGNWPLHGDTYYDQAWIARLAKDNSYDVLELDQYAAQWNTTDGWLVQTVLKKTLDQNFISLGEFSKYNRMGS